MENSKERFIQKKKFSIEIRLSLLVILWLVGVSDRLSDSKGLFIHFTLLEFCWEMCTVGYLHVASDSRNKVIISLTSYRYYSSKNG